MEPTQKLRDDEPMRRQREDELSAIARAEDLEARFGDKAPEEIIAASFAAFAPEELAVVSSFGADSAALLDLVARVDPRAPVIFLDTGQHFGETLIYRDQLLADFGLTNLRIIHPRPEVLAAEDPDARLYQTSTDRCCDIRKVEPMARAVEPYRAWLTGRKRHQAQTRASLPVFEAVGTRVRINPLASWTTQDQAAYMRSRNLRANPLVAYGYLSIGCFPCTQPVAAGEDPRSGRWAGQGKTECGIHLPGLDQTLTS